MNTAEDVRHNDIVYNAHIGEDSVMMSNPNHKWYYLKDQRKDEVLVWRNIDVPNGTKPRKPSSATPMHPIPHIPR